MQDFHHLSNNEVQVPKMHSRVCLTETGPNPAELIQHCMCQYGNASECGWMMKAPGSVRAGLKPEEEEMNLCVSVTPAYFIPLCLFIEHGIHRADMCKNS